MKKEAPFVWDQAYQNAFDSIKKYLLHPLVLGAPIQGKPLILYIAAQEESLGAMLAQNNKENKEQALYYLSHKLTKNELKYSPIEKTCLALVFASQKLRHYFQAHTMHLIIRVDPIKYVMSKPILSGCLARWSLLFNEFEIIYVLRKTVKGQALVDFLANHSIPADWEIFEEFPNENVFFVEVLQPWMMFFDGAARKKGVGSGVIFVSPHRHILPYSFILGKNCSNNVAEYQALIIDVVGPLAKSSTGHLYILATTDYFFKWAEVVPLKEVKKETIVDFIKSHIIYQYVIHRYIITDNGKPFYSSLIDKLCERFGFKQRNSSMYNALANGLVEAFNKTLGNLLKKIVAKSKRDWHKRIGEALWAYHTTHCTPTQATPYFLVYGVEAVLPLEQ
ncbi:uncharacterized protein LOC114310044 [Camellia sinensis]|uniref:uncharacterized protein LOC114310044 n=1 Tax=Camellia sinensis TaxID=4442 RepID=UPI001035FE85|nr:uncharacterized protein LOC114310044 [Camellia sinensis]